MNKLKTIIFCILFLLLIGCTTSNNTVRKEYFGIDVSGSALSQLKNNLILIKDKMTNSDASEINVFIFANDSYEIYDGPKPAKDRQIDSILNLAISKAKKTEFLPGTSFDNVLDYIQKRISTTSNIYIYTDGFFELKKYKNNKEEEIAAELNKKGLSQIKFFGLNIVNKENIYRIFSHTSIKVDLN